MTQEEKDLLLKDLCARLPYGVKVLVDNKHWCDFYKDIPVELTLDNSYRILSGVTLGYVKPCLFPLSSMTEEQWKEITDIQIQESLKSLDSIDDSVSNPLFSTDDLKTIEWCYANHIDIHNLIPIGSAIDATGLNIY